MLFFGDGTFEKTSIDDEQADFIIEIGHETPAGISNNRNLNQCGQAKGLARFINKPNSNGRIPPRIMSDTVEALIGAVFIDSGEGLEAVKGAMRVLGLL